MRKLLTILTVCLSLNAVSQWNAFNIDYQYDADSTLLHTLFRDGTMTFYPVEIWKKDNYYECYIDTIRYTIMADTAREEIPVALVGVDADGRIDNYSVEQMFPQLFQMQQQQQSTEYYHSTITAIKFYDMQGNEIAPGTEKRYVVKTIYSDGTEVSQQYSIR
jgi:hypothetical protein